VNKKGPDKTNQRPQESERTQLPDEAIPAKLVRRKVVVKGKFASMLYEAGYYGTLKDPTKLVLEPEEALLLARRQRIQILDTKGTVLEFSELLDRLTEQRSGLWTRFLVYSDLRSRGYVVRTGYGKGLLFRVYPRGAKLKKATAKYFVCAISEGSPLGVSELETFSRQAKRNRKKLMLAVLDRQGETTYYLVSPADIVAEK
jgi:tRNA-intron endonuclease